ncbi:hypothetical protein BFN03_05645 [Rhodococcus sp. WMMA185]|uniref:hypothetical protein n=1 Tax=Rhodococcus sp. WMMA185 TaxID=679318 RepID=UPI00087816D7|nr:hypothetical protein [Rhodococcus sp. WMMA185]AOW92369.1 hypothetical protein BFN03_05645 [Rhodococcus sp. WMMA185]
MEFNWGGEIWGLMLTRRPSDTHFSESSTQGWKSPLVRDDDNTLVTHAELFDGTKTTQVIVAACAVCVALGAGATKAAPHVMSGLVNLKSKLRRRGEDATDVATPVPLTVVAEAEPASTLDLSAKVWPIDRKSDPVETEAAPNSRNHLNPAVTACLRRDFGSNDAATAPGRLA